MVWPLSIRSSINHQFLGLILQQIGGEFDLIFFWTVVDAEGLFHLYNPLLDFQGIGGTRKESGGYPFEFKEPSATPLLRLLLVTGLNCLLLSLLLLL